MRDHLPGRLVALAAVALLAAVVALAATSRSARRRDDAAGGRRVVRRAAPGRAARRPSASRPRAEASSAPTPRASRTRSCRAARKIYVTYGDTHVLTQVIDRGPYGPGREFDLTRRARAPARPARRQADRVERMPARARRPRRYSAPRVLDPVRVAAHHVEPTLREREPASGRRFAPTPARHPPGLPGSHGRGKSAGSGHDSLVPPARDGTELPWPDARGRRRLVARRRLGARPAARGRRPDRRRRRAGARADLAG